MIIIILYAVQRDSSEIANVDIVRAHDMMFELLLLLLIIINGGKGGNVSGWGLQCSVPTQPSTIRFPVHPRYTDVIFNYLHFHFFFFLLYSQCAFSKHKYKSL
jgi:hypothetical protein